MEKVAIVTGAGSGIGRATAKRLLRGGWRVVLVGRTEANLASTAEQSGHRDRATIRAVDVTDPAACDSLVASVDAEFGRVDALCNVAGYAALASIADTTDELWRRTIDTNLSAVVFMTRACWPTFRRWRGGVVVNVSSMASIDPFPGFAAYAAAKAAVNMFTLVTGREGEPIGVRAVAIAPGAVETPMLRSLFDTESLPPTATLSPADVALVIVSCVTGERAFQPGQTISVVPPH